MQRDDDPEMDQVDAGCGRNRYEDGGKDQDDDHGFDEHATDEEQDVHHQQDHEYRGIASKYALCEHLGNTSIGDDPGKGSSDRYQDEYDGCDDAGRQCDTVYVADLDTLVDEHLYDQRIQYGDGGGLGRAEDPRVDSTHDDQGEAEREKAVLRRDPPLRPRGFGNPGNLLHFRIDGAIDAEHDQDHDRRSQAGDKQLAYGGAAGYSVYDHA